MDTVLDRPKTSWVKPTRKLTEAEIEQLIENYDYVYDEDDDSTALDPVYDAYGNPTESTIRAIYEGEHGLTTTTTLEELIAWVDSL